MCFCVCLHMCVSVCVCAHVSFTVSMAEFHKAFHSCLSFLSSRNTSLHHSSKTPPLLVSQLFDWHAAAYFPQLCLLCPVVLCTLFLSRVSIFRMAQWCICLLPLTSSTRQSSLFIHTYMTVKGSQNSLHRMCSAWMHAGVDILHYHICILSLFTFVFFFNNNSPKHIWQSVVRSIIPCLNILL